MKVRNLLGTAVLAIMALAFTVPAVGQSLDTSYGLGVDWKIGLYGETAATSGTAEYHTFRASIAPPATANNKLVSKFTVETITPDLADRTTLDVYVGPSTNANQPYGVLVGRINVEGGFGAMILIAAQVPAVHSGSTVSVVQHRASLAGDTMILKGKF